MTLEVRYEPEWLALPRPVLLYRDGVKVGEATKVDFLANASLKRAGRPPKENPPAQSEELVPPEPKPVPAISFARLPDHTGEGES